MLISDLDDATRERVTAQWPDRPKIRRIPYGYKPSLENPMVLEMDLPIVLILDEALNQLDAGISLRVVAEWVDSKLEQGVSHSGLQKIWDHTRPDHPKKIGPKPKVKRTHKQLKRERLSKRNAVDKRTIISAKKRLEARTEVLEELEARIKPVSAEVQAAFALVKDEVEYEDLPQEEEIIFKPNPGPQTAFLAAPEREVLYGGAAGGGKSFALLADPVRYFGSSQFNGLLLRRTNDELRELIWKSQELYPKIDPKAKWSKQQSSWTFGSGGHLWMTYLERDDDVMRYQGQAFSWIGIDELTQYSTPFAWNYLRSRLRTSDPFLQANLSMRGTTNPGGPGHGWVKQMFVDPAIPNTPFVAHDVETGLELRYPEGHERAGEPLFYRRFIPARVSDNPYLWEDGSYEANLLSLPEQQRRQLLDGDWSIVSGAAFPEFRVGIHVCEPFEIPSSWRKFRSCDYGYSQKSAAAVHWFAIDENGALWCYRELYCNQKTGIELAELIKELEHGEEIAYGVLDSAVWEKKGNTGPSIAEEMIRAGVRWRPADKGPGSRVASKNRLHELLKVDSFTQKPMINWFNTCRQIIADLQVIPVDPKGGDDIDDRYTNDHAYDSTRYAIMTRPKPSQHVGWYTSGSKNKTSWKPATPAFGY